MTTHRKAMNGMAGVMLAGALLLVGVVPSDAFAQDASLGWLPWIGCWEAMGEMEDETLLCIRPTADHGVEMLSVLESKVLSQVTVFADGIDHPSSREGCEGNERAQFSDDGRRVYLHAEYLCEGGVERNTSGLMSMNTPYEWMDVKAARVSGQDVAWAQRYRLASKKKTEAAGFGELLAGREMSVSAARAAASAEIEIDDVLDATANVNAKAVEAWVAERGERFDLDGDLLVQMADAGVPSAVVDVVVAVSFPRQFSLGRAGEADAALTDEEFGGEYGQYAGRRYFDPFYFDPFYMGFSPYSRYGRYGYGYGGYGYGGYGYGYGGYGYGGYGYGYTPVYVDVTPRDTGGGGRVVKGRGYTRGSGSSGNTSGTATGRSRTGGSSAASGRSGASGSSSAGRSSSGGRTAKRRGGDL